MNKLIIIAIILYVCISCARGEPTCYNHPCPGGTTNCKKTIKSSYDGRNLEITIICLDDFSGSLKEYFFEEPSTINPHTHYQSTSYSAAGGISNNYYGGRNDLEDFVK